MKLVAILGRFKRIPATSVLLVLTALCYGVEVATNATGDVKTLVRWGALDAIALSEHHEWYRLITPLFLHGGLVHLLLNSFALLQFGGLVEVLWGHRRFVSSYVVCGAMGALTSAWASGPGGPPSVGASGAILGLAGLLLGTALYGKGPVRHLLRHSVASRIAVAVGLTFALGIGLSFLVPIVDNWGHAGGFAAGLAIAAADPDPHRENLSATRPAFALSAVAIATSLLAAAMWGGRSMDDFELVRARALTAKASSTSSELTVARLAPSILQWFHRADEASEGLETFTRLVAGLRESTVLQGITALVHNQPPSSLRDDALLVATERWLEVAPDDPDAQNTTAWLLLTHVEPSKRRPQAALLLSDQSLLEFNGTADSSSAARKAAFLDTNATALFLLGRTRQAAAQQRAAVALAEAHSLDDSELLRSRLREIEEALE